MSIISNPYSMETAAADPIASFSTSSQPISDTTLKVTLLSLWVSLQSDLLSGLHQCRTEVHTLVDRESKLEDQMSKYTTSFNTMVEAHEAHFGDLIKSKLADLEDRSRHKNIN